MRWRRGFIPFPGSISTLNPSSWQFNGRSQDRIMLTVKQAAKRAGISESLVYEWCAEGVLPHYRFGRKGRREEF